MNPAIHTLTVATTGKVDRHDRCVACSMQMLYECSPEGLPLMMFCQNHNCAAFLIGRYL